MSKKQKQTAAIMIVLAIVAAGIYYYRSNPASFAFGQSRSERSPRMSTARDTAASTVRFARSLPDDYSPDAVLDAERLDQELEKCSGLVGVKYLVCAKKAQKDYNNPE